MPTTPELNIPEIQGHEQPPQLTEEQIAAAAEILEKREAEVSATETVTTPEISETPTVQTEPETPKSVETQVSSLDALNNVISGNPGDVAKTLKLSQETVPSELVGAPADVVLKEFYGETAEE